MTTPPTFVAAGTQQNNTGASATVPWPSHQADDIGILCIETSGGSATITVTGWTELSNERDNSTTAGSRFFVFARRATSSSMTDPTVGSLGDHKVCRIHVFRGVDPSIAMSSLIVATGGQGFNYGGSSASSTASPESVTTVTANNLIVFCVSRPDDSASTTHFGTPVNGNLTSLNAGQESGTTDGNGGGFVVAYGVKATPGATGTTTLSKTSSTIDTWTTIALPPIPDAGLLPYIGVGMQ